MNEAKFRMKPLYISYQAEWVEVISSQSNDRITWLEMFLEGNAGSVDIGITINMPEKKLRFIFLIGYSDILRHVRTCL